MPSSISTSTMSPYHSQYLNNLRDDSSTNIYPDSADGTLVVMIVRAKHLPNRRKLDKQSPYVVIRLGTDAKKTKADFRAGQTPEWTHEVRFNINRDRKPLLKIDILDETKNDPTPIGNCEIDASIVFTQPSNEQNGKYIYDKWYDLTYNDKRAGMLYLEMTFYPSAPVLPPKIPSNDSYEYHQTLNQHYQDFESPISTSPIKNENAIQDVFVSSENSNSSKKSSLFSKTNQYFTTSMDSNNSNSHSSHEKSNEVFVQLSNRDGSKSPNKFKAKFSNFKDKFQSKQPLWGKNDGNYISNGYKRNISPISAYESNEIDNLEKEISRSQIGYGNNINFQDDENDDINFRSPPTPRHHQNLENHSSIPVTPDKTPTPPIHKKPLPSTPRRKPPTSSPSLSKIDFKDSTAIPFSADSIGVDDDDELQNHLPTKVYLFDEPVKSLTYNAKTGSRTPELDSKQYKDEIDPQYYAPTPSEHFNRKMKFENGGITKDDLKIDMRTKKTGYLGNGKFSPSVFQKASHINPTTTGRSFNIYDESDDENDDDDERNKPMVPPKIPNGLNAIEYYILEKEKVIKDFQGRRA
ncbi:uncharacterized protein KGF55_000132 [Candida pseudojiufengensis]|uniref:uncharacterized protein n=1 Tax=Candida pseudojiufengensis TaxID=497109 RepID=UPI0022253E69|nr:uncharacterized protein KGF55_000132 [Candida pseudojiufengensis]KAI5966723.1 hypothetical protein KGF55_000132 [Candida pseudojiufengensis]